MFIHRIDLTAINEANYLITHRYLVTAGILYREMVFYSLLDFTANRLVYNLILFKWQQAKHSAGMIASRANDDTLFLTNTELNFAHSNIQNHDKYLYKHGCDSIVQSTLFSLTRIY